MMKNKKLIFLITVFLLPVVFALASLCIGRINIPLTEVLRTLTGGEVNKTYAVTVLKIRLPRIITALIVGAALSVSGCVFQSLFSNPLATPDTLGIAGGASFGAAIAILFGAHLIAIQVSSFLFGLAAVMLTCLAGLSRGRDLNSVVLSGIMIGSLFSSLVSLVKFVADTESQLPAITYFLMGSMAQTGYENLAFGFPVIAVCLTVLLLIRWRLNLLPLSEDEIRSSGVNVNRLRTAAVLTATALTAASVSMCGQVGWIGLIVPHICRLIFGSNHKTLIPACASLGAAFTVAVDTLARSITSLEIPISILTAIIGTPFFIILMRKRFSRWGI